MQSLAKIATKMTRIHEIYILQYKQKDFVIQKEPKKMSSKTTSASRSRSGIKAVEAAVAIVGIVSIADSTSTSSSNAVFETNHSRLFKTLCINNNAQNCNKNNTYPRKKGPKRVSPKRKRRLRMLHFLYSPEHWQFFYFIFYCIAELAVKPCRSSRSKTRGGLRKSLDTCKTGSKQKHKAKATTNTPTPNDRRQVSVDGETCGEKKVKRPKLSCVELLEEA